MRLAHTLGLRNTISLDGYCQLNRLDLDAQYSLRTAG